MADFKQYDVVKHRASGEQAIVLREVMGPCTNPAHVKTTANGDVLECPVDRVGCVNPLDRYLVSHGFMDYSECWPGELELVASVPPPPPPALATRFEIGVTSLHGESDPSPTIVATLRAGKDADGNEIRELLTAEKFPTRAKAREAVVSFNKTTKHANTFATFEEHAKVPITEDDLGIHKDSAIPVEWKPGAAAYGEPPHDNTGE